MKSGIKLLEDKPGDGPVVERQHVYLMRIKMWLNQGQPIRWERPSGFVDRARLEDEGQTLIADLRVDRESLINGLFYGIEGMRIGGTRRLRVSPHLAYGVRGIPGIVPENAVIEASVEIIEERCFDH